MRKVSILIPTYNDCNYIIETLSSIYEQDYSNYEILICDDGSTDDTKKIVDKYKKDYDKKNIIKYIYQDNADQLNAIIKLMDYITGEYVYILHSDDLLYDKNTLTKMVNYIEKYDVDSIVGDICLIDKDSNVIGEQKVSDYVNKKYVIPLQLLWLGRNLYNDMGFHKKEVFVNNVYNNYLLWNGPFWLNIDNNNILNAKKSDFPFFKYRISDDNYLNNEGAKYNVINGEIRVVTRLLNYYSIPFYKFQYIIYRIFNRLNLIYIPLYKNKPSKNKYAIIKFVLNKRFSDEEINNNLFLNSLVMFYKNKVKRTIELNNIDTKIYYGKDMRIFNKKLMNNSINKFYIDIFKEMEKGFDEVVVNNKKDYDKSVQLLKFLCIYPYVKVSINDIMGD